MRRPLCAFCLSALGVLALCSFLPQTGLLLLSAAIFVGFCLLVWWKGGAARGYAVCLLLGALVGVGIRETTDARLAKIQGSYAGQEAVLTAEVESIGRAYGAGRVSAVLRVETVDGEAVRFRVECVSLPRCEAGGLIRGRFALDLPDATQRLSDYADGITLSAEYQSGMLRLGPGRSFRARTARLQAALSRALRGGMAENTGGVLAAMAAGDKSHLSSALRSAYRGAGLSHVLVVSGLHVTIFCGLLDALPRRERERSRAYRRARSLLRAGTALLLVGITGVTPSVLRAAVAVWISSLGVWLGGPADTLTSLAAVLGTLAGGVCAKRGQKAYYNKKKRQGKKPSRPVLLLRRLAGGVWDALCVSLCASAATFPVLVLRGMSATVWAVVSGVAVLWMVGPMLGLSLGAALLGLAAQNFGSLPLFEILRRPIAFCAEGLAFGMNEWAFRVSGLPGASLWFDGGYAALVCLVLFLLCAAAMRWNVRLRAALPTVVLLAALAFGLETALSWNVVNIELVGTQAAPAVVITRRERAVVLFRGSSITQRAVETQLEKRGVKTVELLVNLRMQPETPCDLKAETRIEAAALAADTTRRAACGGVDLEFYRTRQGCIVRLTIGRQRFVTVSGTVRPAKPIRAEWLLASMARPDNIRYTDCLTLSRKYRWMRESDAVPVSRLRLRLAG